MNAGPNIYTGQIYIHSVYIQSGLPKKTTSIMYTVFWENVYTVHTSRLVCLRAHFASGV